MLRLNRIFLILTCGMLLSGCFTGIESTPKITDSEVRRQQPKTTPEDLYLKEIEESTPQMTIGKYLIVTDPKIRLVLDRSYSDTDLKEGDTLRLEKIDETVTFDGQRLALLVFTDRNQRNYAYRTSISPEYFKKNPSVSVPFTVDLEKVDAVRRKMAGNTYYIMTSAHYDKSGNLVYGRRFVPVRITSVQPGNEYYPVRLDMSEVSGNAYSLYMSVDAPSTMPRRFATLFSLSDPRLKYPTISDSNWELITEGKVAQGMTREECRLALGVPDKVDRQPGYSILHEVWSYNNGRLLVFEDGILQSFRQ